MSNRDKEAQSTKDKYWQLRQLFGPRESARLSGVNENTALSWERRKRLRDAKESAA